MDGRSGWTFNRKVDYLLDSCFSFTEWPVKLLMAGGAVGIIGALGVSAAVLAAYMLGDVSVPGYVPIMLAIGLSFAAMMLSMGIVGNYAWRAYENTKRRPPYLELSHIVFEGADNEDQTRVSGHHQ
jgi:hypothetical protein